jgi:periplasmic divalent cation tolerance protein
VNTEAASRSTAAGSTGRSTGGIIDGPRSVVGGIASGTRRWIDASARPARYAGGMADYVQVVTTTDSEEAAASLARSIVEARVGACVQVVPIHSFYRWDNAVQDDPEWQLQIKTSASRLDPLIEHINTKHTYDVPEIIATPIIGGNDAYLSWVVEETQA